MIFVDIISEDLQKGGISNFVCKVCVV